MNAKLKTRVCKNKGCNNTFTQFNSIETWCSPACGYEISQAKLKESYKKETTKLKKDFYANDRKHQEKLAEKACHLYIRTRDQGLPCIDCGRTDVAQWHAGHYKTRGGFPELKYNELNIHKQCSQCNKDGLKGMIHYRANLLIKIGEEKLNWLEAYHPPQHLTLEDIKGVTWWYKTKLEIIQSLQWD